MEQPAIPEGLLVLVPAFNEEGAIGGVVAEIHEKLPGVPVLVVDDCSTDGTAVRARTAGSAVLSLPNHLGLGGAVQAGYKLAYELGYSYVIRIDGDGQHDPADIRRMYEVLRSSRKQMVIGSRFLGADANGRPTSLPRMGAIRFFRMILRPILGKSVLDPTSGFVGVNRQALGVFARSFPLEYPEIEALVVLQRRAFDFVEIPCSVRPRKHGRSSITPMRSITYMVHVLLGVLVNVLRFGPSSRQRPAVSAKAGDASSDER